MPKVLRIHDGAHLLPINRSEGKVSPKKSDGGSQRVPVRLVLGAEVKYFGRHRNGMIWNGVVRSVASLV
jgi:hypothetical protein